MYDMYVHTLSYKPEGVCTLKVGQNTPNDIVIF